MYYVVARSTVSDFTFRYVTKEWLFKIAFNSKIRMSKIFYFCWLLLKPEVPSAAFNLVPFVLYLVAASISRNPGGR